MTYIAPLKLADADSTTAATLNAVKAKVGMIPNLYATLAKAPSALKSLLEQNAAAATGKLSAGEREIISLATSQANGCHYCLSAHTLLGKHAGLTPEDIAAARAGKGSDARRAAIAGFAIALVEQRGHVDAAKLDQYKAAGLTEADLLEIVANVSAMILTNYANNVARTTIDFSGCRPEVGGLIEIDRSAMRKIFSKRRRFALPVLRAGWAHVFTGLLFACA